MARKRANSASNPNQVAIPGAESPDPTTLVAHNEVEGAVFGELFNRGIGNAVQITNRLSRRGQRYSREEVTAALESWAQRGWVILREDGQAHLSAAALAFLR